MISLLVSIQIEVLDKRASISIEPLSLSYIHLDTRTPRDIKFCHHYCYHQESTISELCS
jgi:hypothetical protein